MGVGPLKVARYLEPVTGLLIKLAYSQGMGADISLGLSRP
jgi:predicted dinucleotide-binding enzyme